MRVSTAIAFAAATAIGANAGVSVVTNTVYYDDCSTNTGPEYSSTVTGTIISTYCPACAMDQSSAGSYAMPSAPGIYTTYTTVFSEVCSTGLQPVTYTVTESCSSTGVSRGSSYVPQGYTVVTVPCSMCEMKSAIITTPIASTLTVPASASTPYALPTASGLPAVAASPMPGTGSPAAPVVTAPAGGAATVHILPLASVVAPSATASGGSALGSSGNSSVSPPIMGYRGSGVVSATPVGFTLLAGLVMIATIHYTM